MVVAVHSSFHISILLLPSTKIGSIVKVWFTYNKHSRQALLSMDATGNGMSVLVCMNCGQEQGPCGLQEQGPWRPSAWQHVCVTTMPAQTLARLASVIEAFSAAVSPAWCLAVGLSCGGKPVGLRGTLCPHRDQ